MDSIKNGSDKQPLVDLKDYGLPPDMAAQLHAFYERPELQSSKILAAELSAALHQASAEQRSAVAAVLIQEKIAHDDFCHALGWLALEFDALSLQSLYLAIPEDKKYYAHAEWVVPFEAHKNCELSFSNQYFIAHYNQLYDYPQNEPPGVLTRVGLCAQVLSLLSYRQWATILPTTNQMIKDFNKLLWLNRDFDFLSQFSQEERPENFQAFYDAMVKAQEKLIAQSKKSKEQSSAAASLINTQDEAQQGKKDKSNKV